MATRLYLRNTTANVGSFARTELSNQTPSVDGGHAARDLSDTKGSAQTSLVTTTLNSATTQLLYYCKFISPPITSGNIAANTWTIALACAESSTNANMFIADTCIYVMTSAGVSRGSIVDSTASLGVEMSVSEDGQVVTTAGIAKTGVLSTDVLVFELWARGVISMTGLYDVTYWFDGATDVTGATTTDAASYIETPQTLTFSGGAPPAVLPPRPTVLQQAINRSYNY